MSGDTLVYDMASMSEGTPQIFVKKDWLNILDNQNGNYNGNQCVIDTSQLANSNKYMNYREAYLAIPMVLTAGASTAVLVAPQTAATSADHTFGLKNWFGSIVHSMTLDYNGTTIIQQTPYIGLWNSFKLMTTLSKLDIDTNGATMGFYPDDALAFGFVPGSGGKATGDAITGVGTFNNINYIEPTVVNAADTCGNRGNIGFLKRQQFINYDAAGIAGGFAAGVGVSAYSALLTTDRAGAQYMSQITTKAAAAATGCFQISIMATVHLKHLHNFFANVPLLKGVFMKLTLNLNQGFVTLVSGGTDDDYSVVTVTTTAPQGGVLPIMIASQTANSGGAAALAYSTAGTIVVSLGVGTRPPIASGHTLASGQLPQSVQLYVPAYTFNSVYETAYLSSPVKKIVYTDVYQYQVLNIAQNASFNNLLTNGIANIKSVLILPFFTTSANADINPLQSPFDPAGAGPTSPLCLLTNFNVVVAGQNMIYNTQRYSYEQFIHQLQGANSINADLTDGLTSSLIDRLSFEREYCYYYVNCSRMLPVEEAVPKSISIIGQNSSLKAIDLYCFIEYGVEVSIDVNSGARV